MTTIVTSLPPIVLQEFNTWILDPLGRFLYKRDIIVLFSKKKIRSQDTGKQKELQELLIKFESTYERKKVEEAEYNKKIKDAQEKGPNLSNAGTIRRFTRMES